MSVSRSIRRRYSQRVRNVALLACTMTVVTGCVTTPQTSTQIDRLEAVGENPRILLMSPDIRYYLLTAGGVTEPNAEWTEAAQTNFLTAVKSFADFRGIDLATIDEPDGLAIEAERYLRLHSAVGITLQTNHFGMMPLPSKRMPDNQRRFDWSLGPGVSEISDSYDADYLLFVFYRDYQATGGRVAFAILAGLAGAAVSTGYEGGFASLVDLRTGDVVWFNNMALGSGEMREPQGAVTAVAALLADLPTN